LGLLRAHLQPAQLAELSQVYQQSLTPSPAPPPAAQRTAAANPPAVWQSQDSNTLGPYELLRELARGGMGVVYVARRAGMEREVALKVLLTGDEADEREVQRFMAEVKITSRLEHPNLIRISDTGLEQGRHYFVMDLIDGPSLDGLIKQKGPLEPAQAAEITAKVARALAYAHGRAVLHRDLKPHNILLRGDGEPILTDFGVAKDVEGASHLTQAGDMVGTPAYMPPEQTGGELEVIDRRSDVYSLGATLFHLLLGRAPFEGDSIMSVVTRALRDAPPSPLALRPEVGRDLDTIVLKCLEKEQDQRYATMSALADDLERYLRHEPIAARPPNLGERLRKWVRRNRAVASVTAVAALVLLVGTGAAGLWIARAERAKRFAELNQQQEAQRVQDAREQVEDSHAQVAPPKAEALKALAPAERRERLDEALSTAMEALAKAQLWRGLAPEDSEAIQATVAAARMLGEVALLGEQWSMAAQAFRQVSLLLPGDERSLRDMERVSEARTAESRRRRAAIEAILARAKSGELREEPRGLESAVFAILRDSDPHTWKLLADALSPVTARLDEARRELYRTLNDPTPIEVRAGLEPSQELAGALEVCRKTPGLEAPQLSTAQRRALRDIEERGRQRYSRQTKRLLSFDSVLATTQRGRIEPGLLYLGRLCCRALGRLGYAQASEALACFLRATGDEGHAAEAAFSLVLLGTGPGLASAERAKTRFPELGAFNTLIGTFAKGSADTFSARQTRAEGFLRRRKYEQGLAEFEALGKEHPKNVPVILGLAQCYLYLGRLDEAQAAARSALTLAPKNSTCARLLAQIERVRGNQDEAIRWAKKAVELAPRSPLERAALGWAYYLALQVPQALKCAEKALALDAECSTGLVLKGTCELALGRKSSARVTLERAIEINPYEPEAYASLSRLESESGRVDAGLARLEQGLDLAPRSPVLWHTKAQLLADQGQARQAERAFDRLLEIVPRDMDALGLRGLLRALQGNRQGSFADFERAAEIGKDAHLLTRWGRAAKAWGDLAMAHQKYGEALELEPKHLVALIRRAELHRHEKHLDLSRADLERAYRIDARATAVLYALTVTCYEQGDLARAGQAAEVLVQVSPESNEAWRARGTVWLYKQNYEAARADLARAVKIQNQDGLAWNRLGLAEYRLGRLKPALESLTKATALLPKLPEAWANRGQVLADSGRFAQAIPDYAQALALNPKDGVTRWNRAVAYLHVRKRAEALKDFERLAPEDAYAALWIAGVSGDTKALSAHAKEQTWISAIVRYYLGQLDLEALLKLADRDPTKRAGRRCEVHAYVALRAEREGNKARALKHYRLSVAAGAPPTFEEHKWARARVKVLGN
jgi:tetratricopeptide (TPR) repeat protein/predicted Ser/Thr protein kinase